MTSSSPEAPKVFYEVVRITELAQEKATIALNDELFDGVEEEEAIILLDAFYTLCKTQLMKDLKSAGRRKLSINPSPEFKRVVFSLSMLSDEDSNFDAVVNFGSLADPAISLKEGLAHVLQVLELAALE